MIFDELPFELKEHVFTYVSPNDWINTAKVSNEWMELTLGSIIKIVPRYSLILDNLAEFINQRKNTNYTWVSLLTLMPKLEHLECIESTEAFWREISPVSHQLRVLRCRIIVFESIDWNKLEIIFKNLEELLWDVIPAVQVFPLNWFAYSPKLEKLTLNNVKINSEWKEKIPKSVKQILLNNVDFLNEHQCYIDSLFEDPSTLETFCASYCSLSMTAASQFFDKTPGLKNLKLKHVDEDEAASMVLETALRKCRDLKNVSAFDVTVTDTWRRIIPKTVKSINFSDMKVEASIRKEVSFDWLFQNYGTLQSLHVKQASWIGFDAQNFFSTKNLKKLVLHNGIKDDPEADEPIGPFSDICVCMIRGSHLVDIGLLKPVIDESWRHIFPPTVKRLKLVDFDLSKEAQLVFSPQFICENPSNIEFLFLDSSDGDLPAMDLNAFRGMNKLQELHLFHASITGECLQSILTHCTFLTDLVFHKLQSGALTNVPHDLVLPSLRKLELKEPVDQPSLLFEHFPKVHAVDIAIVASEASFSAIINALQVVKSVTIKIGVLPLDILRTLVESIDDTKFTYFCLSYTWHKFNFHFTNSLLNASQNIDDIFAFGTNGVRILWINNYQTSTLPRINFSTIPSSFDELSLCYDQIMLCEYWYY